MDDHYTVVEQDGSMTDGGLKSYQNELIYREPEDNLDKVDQLCLFMESRLV